MANSTNEKSPKIPNEKFYNSCDDDTCDESITDEYCINDKHEILTITNKKTPKYCCNYCDYNTSNKKDYNRHLSTDKHQRAKLSHENPPKTPDFYECSCGKIYKHLSSLCKHKNKCEKKSLSSIDKDDLIIMLIKQNAELMNNNMSNMKDIVVSQQNTIIELTKNGINNTNMNQSHNTITSQNSHNKTFNLQFFLNETCKDAMNIMDFVNSIKLQLSDLENVGELGYVEGISNIIRQNLKQLDVTQRPIHCTDKKRETVYIKDEDKWEKEEETNPKMRKVIRHVSHKNAGLLQDFREKYPDCGTSSSKKSDQFNKMVLESMGGSGNNETEKEDKIIQNILDDVCIDKNKYKNLNK